MEVGATRRFECFELQRVLPGIEQLPQTMWDQSLRELLTGPMGARVPDGMLELADRALRELM